MAAPETENYLSVYRQFLKEFTSTVYPNDPLPVKVTGYILDEADLEGEIIDWTRQYLNQRSCPPALATSVARSVLGELGNVIKDYHELRSQGEEEQEPLAPLRKRVSLERASLSTKGPHYDPLRLMHAVVAKVRAVCERYLLHLEGGGAGPGVLPIPPPLPGPPLVSTFAIKNHRRKMEDRHVSIEDLNALFGITTSPYLVGYYAIFDGHHGHEAAAYSAAQLHCLLVHSKYYPQDPEAALKDAFFRADEIFIKKCASSKILSGTTALVALVRHRESLHVAWLGDSLGILVRKGGKITQFVNPHTAEREDERDRIWSTGGAVFKHFGIWRINGTLAISRAIGDPDCKPHVSALADVVSYALDGSEHFMILACDGLWDCVTEAHATAFVYDQLREEPDNHADLSKLLVNLAKSRASNDNISVVVVLLAPVEDILASAPPPETLDSAQEEAEDPCAAEASPADGLAPVGALLCQLLVNGAMDVEAATAAADPSSNPFGAPFKGSPVPRPDDHHSPDVGVPADEGRNHEDDHSAHDDDGHLLDYHHHIGLHHNHHNGHGSGDIMTSSFYGNGGANGEDARHLFGDPSDLGPETDVDLLDDDGMMVMDVGQAAEEEYKARALEFGVEDGLGDLIFRQHPVYPKEGDLLAGGDFSTTTDLVGASPHLPKDEEGGPMDLQVEDRPAHFNPFAEEGEDWERGKSGEVEGVDRLGATQFEEEPSTRQHYSDVVQLDLAEEEEEVIPCKEEPAVEKQEVVPDEEGIEVGGGSGLEEADDDSEEEGEWKYVSAKPGEGGAVVPEAVSPEADLPDETSCSPALPEQDLVVPTLSPALPPRLEVVTPEASKTEDFETEDIEAETCNLKAEEVIADDDKFCQDLGFEVVQKTHVEEVVCEPGLLEKPVEEQEPQVVPGEGDLQRAKSPQQIEEDSEDSTMESRLNPDAAEFVPVSPTQNITTESYSGFDNDFDTFKKEAEACPGEVSAEVDVTSTPKSLANRVINEDLDAVLSSSFNHDTPKPSDMLQDETLNVLDTLTSTNDFHDDDDNKENISQEGEDKENMSQNATTSDVGSVLNHSFEEHVAGNDTPVNLFGCPLNSSRTENKDESEMICESMDQGLTTNLVPEMNISNEKLIQEMEQLDEMIFEVSAPIQNVCKDHTEPIHSTQSGEVRFNQSSDFMQPETADLFQQVPDDEKILVKDYLEQIQDSFKMESSPELGKLLEADTQMEMLDLGETLPQNTEEHLQHMSYPPTLQICPMKLVDVKEEHIQSELPLVLNVGQEDSLLRQDESQEAALIEESNQGKPVTTEAEIAEFNTESSVKSDEEVEPSEVQSVLPTLEIVSVSPFSPNITTELSSIIEGTQSLLLEETVPAVEKQIQKMEEEISEPLNVDSEVEISEPMNVASEVEIVQEVITQNLENHVLPSSEKVASPELVEIVDLTDEQNKSETISLVDIQSSEPLVEDHPKEVVADHPKEVVEDHPKEVVEDHPKEVVEDHPKEVVEDHPKEVVEDHPKEVVEDHPNEVVEDHPKEVVEDHPKEVVEDHPKEVVESIPADVSKAAAVGGAAAAVAVAAGLATAAVTSASSDAKPAAKKPAAADKKQVPDKSRVSSAATAKTKSSPKPPVTAARTTAPKRAAAPPTTKTAPVPAARTTIAERKPAASTAKPAAATKPTTATSLSSKPKTTGSKPTTTPPSRLSSAPRTSAAPPRPSTASSTATKSGVTATSSKPATSSLRPSTAPPKTTEVKKMLNGDASKPTPTSTAPSKTSPRKPPTSTSATASKTIGATKPLATTRGAAASGKTATETAAAKAKQSSVASAVNGAVPKTTKTTVGAGPKPSPSALSRTKPTAPARGAAPTAPGNAKKAKESVNKHISATRLTGVTSQAQKSADGKSAGSPAGTKASPKSQASVSLKAMANGTPGKKPEVNSNSKKVEDKVELLIPPHENGIALDCNEMRKELEGVVGMEDDVHEAKEQMVLLGDTLSIGEAV